MVNKKLSDNAWKRQYLYTAHGQPTIKLDGYVDLAHDDGLNGIDTTIIQTPHEQNDHRAVVRAAVTTRKGSFSAHGSANPQDAEDKPLIQMAEARALTRALALATNNGLGDEVSDTDSKTDEPARPAPTTQTPKPTLTAVPTPDSADERPANQTQLLTIAKFSEQLGDPIEPDPDMGHDAANELIRQLNDSLKKQRQAQRQRQRA